MNHSIVLLGLLAASSMPSYRHRDPRVNGWAGKCRGRAWGHNDLIAKMKKVERRRRLRKENKNP